MRRGYPRESQKTQVGILLIVSAVLIYWLAERELRPVVQYSGSHWLTISTWKVGDYEGRVFRKLKNECRRGYEIVDKSINPPDSDESEKLFWQVICL